MQTRWTHVGQSETGRRKVTKSQILSKTNTHTHAGQYNKMSVPRDHQASCKTQNMQINPQLSIELKKYIHHE